ncbi:MAG: helix-turn-helix domain-containing protein [Prolixibacteraceae bacterium]|nr:helix-turn-helix domain-containing protein [Prolixibacteraceae bacterium]
MKLHIKNMVSNRCKMIVKSELEKLGLHFMVLGLGEVEIMETLSDERQTLLNDRLNEWGLSLINDKKSVMIEKIKNTIIELIHYTDEQIKINFSDYLSQKLNYDYTYLSNIFKENQGTTIEHFLLTHRIEKAKELLVYDELNVTEIADKLHFSNVAHLSNQFKKMTGLTPSYYKHLKLKRRNPLENV